jgi:hypothetical protein
MTGTAAVLRGVSEGQIRYVVPMKETLRAEQEVFWLRCAAAPVAVWTRWPEGPGVGAAVVTSARHRPVTLAVGEL